MHQVCTRPACALHALCTRPARALHALCTHSARAMHALCTPCTLYTICTRSARSARSARPAPCTPHALQRLRPPRPLHPARPLHPPHLCALRTSAPSAPCPPSASCATGRHRGARLPHGTPHGRRGQGGQEPRPRRRLSAGDQQRQGRSAERLPPTRAHPRRAADGVAARLGNLLHASQWLGCRCGWSRRAAARSRSTSVEARACTCVRVGWGLWERGILSHPESCHVRIFKKTTKAYKSSPLSGSQGVLCLTSPTPLDPWTPLRCACVAVGLWPTVWNCTHRRTFTLWTLSMELHSCVPLFPAPLLPDLEDAAKTLAGGVKTRTDIRFFSEKTLRSAE